PRYGGDPVSGASLSSRAPMARGDPRGWRLLRPLWGLAMTDSRVWLKLDRSGEPRSQSVILRYGVVDVEDQSSSARRAARPPDRASWTAGVPHQGDHPRRRRPRVS